MQLFVLGMHRSGTSAVTRILNMAGAYFGPEGISNGADEGNPKGFWERLDVRAVCDGLLQDAGFDWWRVADFSIDEIPEDVRDRHLARFREILFELDAHRPWVLKEPRLSLLLPLIRPLLEVPVCIHVTREPIEVAESLRARNGIPVAAGLGLWEVYTAGAFAASAGLPRLLVRYEELMADPIGRVARLLEELGELGVQGLRVPSDQEISAYVTADLHRQHRSASERRGWLSERQAEMAAPFDEGRLPEPEESGIVSEGGRDALRSYAFDHDRSEALERRAEAAEESSAKATKLAAATAEQVEAHKQRAATLKSERDEFRVTARSTRSQLDHLEEDTANLHQHLGGALRRAEGDVRGLVASRSWRVAERLNNLHRMVTLKSPERGPVDRLITDIRRARSHLERESKDKEGARAGAAPPASEPIAGELPPVGAAPPAQAVFARPAAPERPPAARAGSRRSVAVIAWDVGHNPLGRAHVLAGMLARRFDVEIWGTQFERYGNEVWQPLRDSPIPIRTFPGGTFPDHLHTMEAIAGEIEADAIWVSKPRFPSFGLGILAKASRNRPLLLDVDDHELSFFESAGRLDPRDLIGRRDEPDLALPFGKAWTQVCESSIDAVDQVTVSNSTLQDRFGGLIVPHARDEAVFDPDLYDREPVRHELGLDESHRLLLFGGTARVHKGVVEVVRALDRLGDERYRLLCFGTREFEAVRKVIGPLERWIIVLPQLSFRDLPRIVGAADLACVLQDPAHAVSRYQMPAKLTDAMAMGVPCLVSPVPPLAPLIDAGIFHVHDGSVPLHECIAAVFDDPDDSRERAQRGRKVFLESYSYQAVGANVGQRIDQLLGDTPPLSPGLIDLANLPRQVFSAGRAPRQGLSEGRGRSLTAGDLEKQVQVRVPGQRRTPFPTGDGYDIVMFWKQNDSGIYGRRQDMFVKYLERSERVHSIVHFDRPITPEELYWSYRKGRGRGGTDQNRLVVRQTLERIVHRSDAGKVHRHTYVYGGAKTGRLGFRAQPHYVDHVRTVLARYDFGRRPLVLWAYPTNDDLPGLIDALDPDLVVTDLVDDHRTFAAPGSARREAFESNYREVIARSDVVLANCEPVAESMRDFSAEVHVVPNGCEIRPARPRGPRPPALADLEGPIIGYVGNLSQRLDVRLLDDLVLAHPEWQFVFVGSAHHDRSVLMLESEPNVHFLGVKPYDEVLALLPHIDVALIPHLVNDMTESMNPLKAYVYCSAGVPVVSTPVANLAELEALVTIAEGPEGFGKAIDAALTAGRREPDLERLAPHSWDVRIERALDLVDEARSRLVAGTASAALQK